MGGQEAALGETTEVGKARASSPQGGQGQQQSGQGPAGSSCVGQYHKWQGNQGPGVPLQHAGKRDAGGQQQQVTCRDHYQQQQQKEEEGRGGGQQALAVAAAVSDSRTSTGARLQQAGHYGRGREVAPAVGIQ